MILVISPRSHPCPSSAVTLMSTATAPARSTRADTPFKLNCARLLADPPCAPLDRAHILDAVSHITSVDYWFLNISTGAVPPRTLHFTVAVDDLSASHARDFDCPSLDRGEMAIYNLVRATENGADVTNPCSFEPHPDASASLGRRCPV